MHDTRENLHLNNYQTAIFFHECSSVITYLLEIQNTVDVTKRLIGLKLIYDRKMYMEKMEHFFQRMQQRATFLMPYLKTNFVIVLADHSSFAWKNREFGQFQRDSNNFVGASYELV